MWMALGSTLSVSLISLLGLALIPLSEQKLREVTYFLVSLAMGALFGDVVFHLLPEIFSKGGSPLSSSIGIMLGILCSFVLEKFLRWKHGHGLGHDHEAHAHGHPHPIKPVARILLVSDGMHNMLDGLLIGASYMVSPSLGLATTLAVLLHEIPHEIGDFGVLLDAGYTRIQALLLNFGNGCLALLGVLIAYGLGRHLEMFSTFAVAVTAGFFVYIAGANLTPEMHKESSPRRSLAQFFGIILGSGMMLAMRWVG